MKHFISSLSVLCANTPPCKGRISSRKILSLLLILFLSIGNAWGAEKTVSWTVSKDALGSGIGSGTITTGTYTWSYTRTLISGSSYTGTSLNNGYLQIGKNGGVENLAFTTSAIPGTIKSVAVDCASYNNTHNISITVGGTTYLEKTATPKWSNNAGGTKTGTGESSGEIVISFTDGSRALYIKSITVVYEETSSGGTEPVLSSIAISGDLTNKTYEEGVELDLTGLTVQANYESGDPKDVTNEVEWSYTPNPLTKGTTSVEVTATYEDKTATQTINGLTVNEHIITPGEYCITPNNTFWGTNYTGTNANAATTLSGKQDDISILHTKSGSNLYVNDSQTRVYENHTMKISVPLGYVITAVVFTADGTNWKGTHTADVGEMTDSKTWTGANQNVTITFGGTCRITNICVTYIKDVKYALTITEPTEGGTLVVKDGENTLTSGAEIYEGTKLTVTATPETGYEEGVVVVKNASDEEVTATVYADGVLTMPAYAVTISATFEKKPCTLLTTPVVTATPTYNSATLTWEAVVNAVKYSVTVGETTTEVTEPTYTATGLNAETTYTYQVKAIAEAEQDMYCDSEVAEGSFTTTAAPVATLTLSDIEGTTTKTGALNGTITLPTTAAECSKTFVGWDSKSDCAVAPEYAPGAEYTLAAENQTLYAVYADGEAGGTVTITPSKGTEETKACTFNLDQDGYTLSASGGGSNPVYNETNSDARIYAGGILTLTATKAMNTIVIKLSAQGKKRLAPITVSTGTIATQAVNDATVTWTGNATEVVFTVGDKANFGSDGETKAGQLCFSTIEVTHSSEYSNYSTTCAAALEKPIFSVAEGTYTEAKSIELSATEGDIYYTLDGTEPTEESTPYTAAVDLDECGTTTIKAIAISTESQSPVASATYTINLPIPANSASDPYTSDEAKDVYASGCYNDEWVYVTGTVQTAQYYSSSGSYTITLTDGFQFYYFFKDDQQTKFADGEIETGDVLVACGQLSEHNGNCQLAKNCYLVSIEEYTDPKTDISNTIDNPYTVTQADELIDDITSDLTKTVFVKGVVTGFATNKVTIRDTREGTEYIELYKHTLATGITPLSQGDLIIATGTMAKYNGTTYQMNEGCQVVWKKAAATITIADITMEVDEVKTISATVDPAEAEVTYTIKENAANAISLDGKTITALAEGTATITATVAEGATYLGNSVDFTVTVKPQNIAILPFTFNGGKADIENTSGMTQEGLGTDYSSAPNSQLKFDHTGDWVVIHFDSEPGELSYNIKNNSFSGGTFSVQESADGETYTDVKVHTEITGTQNEEHTLLSTSRYIKFIYTTKSSGNVGLGNIKITKLSVLRDELYDGKWGTFCPDHKVTNMQGASFYTLTYLEMKDGMPYKLFFDEITTDYLEAGKPYLFIAEGEEIKGVKSGEVVSDASNYNGFYGNVSGNIKTIETTQTGYVTNGDVVNYYGVINSRFTLLGNGTTVAHERAYVQIKNGQLNCPNPPASLPALAPGARRVVAGATGINTATGVDQVQGDNVPTKMIINGQLFILRGEKMYDAQGKLVK